ncbi:hypothetical protein BH10ACT1_BH10ACT1_30240 [soil metagenome]
MTRLHRPTPDSGRSAAARTRARLEAASHEAELAERAELGSLRPRRSGFESFGFVVGADGSATGGSASAALAALGVVSGQLQPGAASEVLVLPEAGEASGPEEATIIDLTTQRSVVRPAVGARAARIGPTARQA